MILQRYTRASLAFPCGSCSFLRQPSVLAGWCRRGASGSPLGTLAGGGAGHRRAVTHRGARRTCLACDVAVVRSVSSPRHLLRQRRDEAAETPPAGVAPTATRSKKTRREHNPKGPHRLPDEVYGTYMKVGLKSLHSFYFSSTSLLVSRKSLAKFINTSAQSRWTPLSRAQVSRYLTLFTPASDPLRLHCSPFGARHVPLYTRPPHQTELLLSGALPRVVPAPLGAAAEYLCTNRSSHLAAPLR